MILSSHLEVEKPVVKPPNDNLAWECSLSSLSILNGVIGFTNCMHHLGLTRGYYLLGKTTRSHLMLPILDFSCTVFFLLKPCKNRNL